MSDPAFGFAVIYRWRLKPGTEASFRAAWEIVTRIIRDEHGGLGSRLHRVDDGSYLAYAQWPDRASWAAMQSAPPADPMASGMMADCVEERLSPILLEPLADLLVTGDWSGGAADPGHQEQTPQRDFGHVVTAGHESKYPDPVRFGYGDRVVLGETDPDFPGWVRVTDTDGRTGWAPESMLERRGGSTAVALEDYDATELDVSPGDAVTIHRELAGWYRVSTPDGRLGWIPTAAVGGS
jgi:quinol monooxygenase YgiN